jgi:signal transduction histidine kinase
LQKTLEKEGCPGGPVKKYFNVLNEEIDRLNRIVVDFLFAVRPITLELREGDINKLVLQTIELVRYEMEENNIICKLELDEKLPYILMDGRYIKQVLINLVKNAQAAMPDGGTLSIITNCVDNDVHITVKDTGIGISKENIAKIFEPYFTTKETGTGLGLTLAFKIIKEHNGEILITSKLGKGTSFELILPIQQKETRMITYDNNAGVLQ